MKRRIISLLIITILVSSCNTTTRKYKEVRLRIPPDSLRHQLDKIIAPEAVNVGGFVVTSNKKVTTEVDIEIINAKKEADAKDIAICLKNALNHPDSFNTCVVKFTKSDQGRYITTTTSKSMLFNVSDL